MAEITVTTQNFESEVLHSEIPVLVDFWATWCGPCRMIAPILEQIAQENPDTLKVAKINIDDQIPLAIRFGVTSIPTLMVFRNGQMTKRSVGAMSREKIEALFK